MEPRIIPYEKSDSPAARWWRPGKVSSHAAVAFYADQARHVEPARRHDLLFAQVPDEQIPNRLIRAFSPDVLRHGRPAPELLGLPRPGGLAGDAPNGDATAPPLGPDAA